MFVPNNLAEIAPELISATEPKPEFTSENEPMTLTARIVYIIAIIGPIAALVMGLILVWGRGYGWLYLSLFMGGYLISAFGVTVGYHRLFCHRAFETSAFVKYMFGVMGSLAVEGSVIKWCSVHRCHHQHSDNHGDPHSPYIHGAGFINMIRGLWHAHVGWMFRGEPKNLSRYVADLVRDRPIVAVSRQWTFWAVAGFVIPTILGGLLTHSWMGVLLGFLWGGAARVFLIHHVTWSINSVCHFWGYKSYRSHDESRNNWLFGILGLGEGWHNNHHAFPTSARHGLRWWELDLSYALIRGLELVGLAWNVRVPNQTRMSGKLAS